MDGLRERFLALAVEWEEQSGPMSGSTQMKELSSFQQIVAMGEAVIPLIFERLSIDPFWYLALAEITGEWPCPKDHAGKTSLMAQDWIEWGVTHGYLDEEV